MRALTVWQPWASLIVHGFKSIENRTWEPPRNLRGQEFAIHAGKKVDAEAAAMLDKLLGPGHPAARLAHAQLPTGAIVGTARFLEALHLRPRDERALWWLGPVGWHLSHARPLSRPVPCAGAQGLWTVPEDVVAELDQRAQEPAPLEAPAPTPVNKRRSVNKSASQLLLLGPEPIEAPGNRVGSIGYENSSVRLIALKLHARGFKRVIDVRQNAWSHQLEFCGPALAAALAREGLSYLHCPFAGNPLRETAMSAKEMRVRYAHWLEQQPSVVPQLAELVAEEPSALMCYEAHQNRCHRGVLLKALQPLGWTAVDL